MTDPNIGDSSMNPFTKLPSDIVDLLAERLLSREQEELSDEGLVDQMLFSSRRRALLQVASHSIDLQKLTVEMEKIDSKTKAGKAQMEVASKQIDNTIETIDSWKRQLAAVVAISKENIAHQIIDEIYDGFPSNGRKPRTESAPDSENKSAKEGVPSEA